MTSIQLYDYYQSIADDSGQDAMQPAVFVPLYTLARMDWLKALCVRQNSEEVRALLRPFTVPEEFAGATIDLSKTKQPLLRLRAVRADFEPYWHDMPVKPAESDQWAEIQHDPFRRGTNDEPRFKEVGKTLTVYGDSVPSKVRIEYVREPPSVDMVSNAVVLEGLDQLTEILARVMGKQDLRDQNLSRYQAWSNREIPASELNNPAG